MFVHIRTVFWKIVAETISFALCRCHQCQDLCDKLQACLGCQRAKYCSKGCQKKHWLSGHKAECTGAAAEGTSRRSAG